MLSVFSKHNKLSDKDIIYEYKLTGNLELLGDLYGRYIDLVFGVCLKYLKNKDDAQDAVIHIFEKISTSIRTSEIDNFKPWLYVVVKNFCLMQLRKVKYNVESLDDASFYSEKHMESSYDLHPLDIDDEWKQNEGNLKQCIEKLKILQKQSVELFYFEKLTYRQISVKMSVEVKKVKSYIQNAKRNLKMCLKTNGE